MTMIQFVIPSDTWRPKHGNVYCSVCKDRSKAAKVPTDKRSVLYRKENASCDDCVTIVTEKIIERDEINSREDHSDAMYSIRSGYGM